VSLLLIMLHRSEEFLELHKMEVEKYKSLHTDYKDIFLKVC